jgi:hypothetical protein
VFTNAAVVAVKLNLPTTNTSAKTAPPKMVSIQFAKIAETIRPMKCSFWTKISKLRLVNFT